MTRPSQPANQTISPEQRRFHIWMQGIVACLVAVLMLWVIGRFRLSLFWGGILAISCWPLFTQLRNALRKTQSGTMLPAAFVACIVLAVLVPATFLASVLSTQAREGMEWIRNVSQNGLPVPDWVQTLPFMSGTVKHWWETNLSQPGTLHHILQPLKTEEILGIVERFGHGTIEMLIIAGFALLILFFLLRSGDALIVRFQTLGHRLFGTRSTLIFHHITGAVRGTMAGLVLVGLGEGALITIAYMIAGAPQAILLGIFTSCASMIPMVGSLALAASVLIILVKCSLNAAAGVGLFGALILFLGDHFVRPVLIGGSIRLPFMWVLLGILGGLETCGMTGLFIGPVVAALAHLAWRLASGYGATEA